MQKLGLSPLAEGCRGAGTCPLRTLLNEAGLHEKCVDPVTVRREQPGGWVDVPNKVVQTARGGDAISFATEAAGVYLPGRPRVTSRGSGLL